MTTITIKQNPGFTKHIFDDLLDLKTYLEDHFFATPLMELDESEITPAMKKKIDETRQMDASEFVDL